MDNDGSCLHTQHFSNAADVVQMKGRRVANNVDMLERDHNERFTILFQV